MPFADHPVLPRIACHTTGTNLSPAPRGGMIGAEAALDVDRQMVARIGMFVPARCNKPREGVQILFPR